MGEMIYNLLVKIPRRFLPYIGYAIAGTLFLLLAIFVCVQNDWDFALDEDWSNALVILLVPFFSAFGVLVLYRLADRTARNLFFILTFLMAVWVLMRLVRQQMPPHTVSRLLWYAYYIPADAIPFVMLLLFARLQQGTFRHYLIPFIVIGTLGATLTVLAMTNDLHSLFYTFPNGVDHYDGRAGYGPLYFVNMAYLALSLGAAVVVMEITAARTKRINLIIAPLLPASLFAIYSLLYIARVPWIRNTPIVNDLPLMLIIYTMGQLILCTQTGIFQNNGAYEKNFLRCSLAIGILNGKKDLLVASSGYRSEPTPFMRVTDSPIRYGYVRVQEDLALLAQIQNELQIRRTILEETRNSLSQESASALESARVRAQAEIFYAMGKITNKTFTEIENLCKSLPDTLNEENRHQAELLLREIKIRLSIIKQQCMLLLRDTPSLSVEDMKLLAKVIEVDERGGGFEDFGIAISGDKDISTDFVLVLLDVLLQLHEEFGFEASTCFIAIATPKSRATIEIETSKKSHKRINSRFASSRGYRLSKEEEDGIYTIRMEKETSHE